MRNPLSSFVTTPEEWVEILPSSSDGSHNRSRFLTLIQFHGLSCAIHGSSAHCRRCSDVDGAVIECRDSVKFLVQLAHAICTIIDPFVWDASGRCEVFIIHGISYRSGVRSFHPLHHASSRYNRSFRILHLPCLIDRLQRIQSRHRFRW